MTAVPRNLQSFDSPQVQNSLVWSTLRDIPLL